MALISTVVVLGPTAGCTATDDPALTGDGPTTTADAPTIDTLLADAARAEKEASGDVAISYDPVTGIPVSATIDRIKDAIDDEMTWSVRDFVVLPTGSASSTGPSSSS